MSALSLNRVFRYANIEGLVRALDDVAEEHAPNGKTLVPLGWPKMRASSGHHFLRRNWWRRGESEYSSVLKIRNLLVSRDAKNAEYGKIAANWNVSGTRDFIGALGLFHCLHPQ